MDYAHFILTRFNVDFLPDSGYNNRSIEYLLTRLELFKKYSYPSLTNQSNQNFQWLVFFSAHTPASFRKQLVELEKWSNFKPIYLDSYSEQEIYNQCAGRMQGQKYLITSRVDNDDSLHRDFVESVQKKFNFQKLQILNFSKGYCFSHRNQRLYRIDDYRCNPFTTLFSETGLKKTILSWPHSDLAKYCQVINVVCEPQWLVVIHDTNIFNRQHGFRILRKEIGNSFFEINTDKWEVLSPDFWFENISAFSKKILKKLKGSAQILISS